MWLCAGNGVCVGGWVRVCTHMCTNGVGGGGRGGRERGAKKELVVLYQ